MSDYEAQAQRFLDSHGLTLKAAFKGDRCPPWCGEDGKGCQHGDRYRVTIRRTGGLLDDEPRSVSFDFWNSIRAQEEGESPSAYDVLSCISSDAYTPETFEDFCGEYGYDTDSRKALDTFNRCRKFADKLTAFFSEEEIAELAEIQ